jgi:hypothetical protein
MADIVNPYGIDMLQDIFKNTLHVIYRDAGVRSQEVNLYVKTEPIAARGRLKLDNEVRQLPMDQESIHVFADLEPLANWAHSARHLFFSPIDGSLMHTESSHFPPLEFVSKPQTFAPLHVSKVHLTPVTPPVLPKKVAPKIRPSEKSDRRFAILFSGQSRYSHLNDLEFLFRVLCDLYGYKEDNIYVLNHDGSLNFEITLGSTDEKVGGKVVNSWPGDKTPYHITDRIVGAGTQAEFDKVFQTIATRLKSTDTLLIHTNNHGVNPPGHGETYLLDYQGNWGYSASEFGRRLADLPKIRSLIVAMQQCHSGGFMHPTLINSKANVTSFAAAVPANKIAKLEKVFNPWAHAWIAAFQGAYPDGSPLKHPVSAKPSTRQAFDYSSSVHHPDDDPVFQDSPSGTGVNQTLD